MTDEILRCCLEVNFGIEIIELCRKTKCTETHCILDVNISRYNIVLFSRDDYITYCSVEVDTCEKSLQYTKSTFWPLFLVQMNSGTNKYSRCKLVIKKLEPISALVKVLYFICFFLVDTVYCILSQ